MTEQFGKFLLALEVLLLLLPLTSVTALSLLLIYPAYPPMPNTRPLTMIFDAAMLLEVIGIVVAWRLAWLYLSAGSGRLSNTRSTWFALVIVAGAVGIIGLAVLLGHIVNFETPRPTVGFALLSPAAVLMPIGLHLLRGRRGGDDRHRRRFGARA